MTKPVSYQLGIMINVKTLMNHTKRDKNTKKLMSCIMAWECSFMQRDEEKKEGEVRDERGRVGGEKGPPNGWGVNIIPQQRSFRVSF